MVIILQVSPDQERRLEECKARDDAAAVREVLFQIVDSNVESLLRKPSPPHPTTQVRRALLEELTEEFKDLPALSDEAMSRDGVYGDHP